MRVGIVDSDEYARERVSAMARRLGHSVFPFVSPRAALAQLTARFDLLLTHTASEGMDAVGFATEIAARMNGSAPSVLLMTWRSQCEFPVELLPRSVIGIIPRPSTIDDLNRVLRFVGKTRDRCPGAIGPFCSRCEQYVAARRQNGSPPVCHTDAYGTCPHYALCRRSVLPWIGMLAGPPRGWVTRLARAPLAATA